MNPTVLSPLGMGGELMIPPTGVNPSTAMSMGAQPGFMQQVMSALGPRPGGIFSTPGEAGAGPAGWSALFGQLAGAITGPNTWQGRVGQVGANWGMAKQYADLLPKLMAGGQQGQQGAGNAPPTNTPSPDSDLSTQIKQGKNLKALEEQLIKTMMLGGYGDTTKGLKDMGLK